MYATYDYKRTAMSLDPKKVNAIRKLLECYNCKVRKTSASEDGHRLCMECAEAKGVPAVPNNKTWEKIYSICNLLEATLVNDMNNQQSSSMEQSNGTTTSTVNNRSAPRNLAFNNNIMENASDAQITFRVNRNSCNNLSEVVGGTPIAVTHVTPLMPDSVSDLNLHTSIVNNPTVPTISALDEDRGKHVLKVKDSLDNWSTSKSNARSFNENVRPLKTLSAPSAGIKRRSNVLTPPKLNKHEQKLVSLKTLTQCSNEDILVKPVPLSVSKMLSIDMAVKTIESTNENDLVQLSVKELQILLETAKKKGRQEMEDLIQSTKKRSPLKKIGSPIEGIVPLDNSSPEKSIPEHASYENVLNINRANQLETTDDESDNDSFVPPTPQADKTVVFRESNTCFMATGLTEEHYSVISQFSNEFDANFSPDFDLLADILIVGNRAITLKWLFARLKGIPIVAIEWIQNCISSGEELDIEPYVLEGPFSSKIPEFFKMLSIILCPPFSKYSERDLTMLLKMAGADVRNIQDGKITMSCLKRIIVADNATVTLNETQRIELCAMVRAPMVDISYLLGALQQGELMYMQPRLLVSMSDQQLLRYGFPQEVVTPRDGD